MSTVELELLQNIQIHTYLRAFGDVLFVYDYLLTLSSEVKYIWSRPSSLSSLLFFSMRYIALFSRVVSLVLALMPISEERCNLMKNLTDWTLVALQLIVTTLLLLRVYALYGRSKVVLQSLSALWVMGVGVCAWSLIAHPASVNSQDSNNGCISAPTQTSGYFLALDWGIGLLCDTLVLVMTVSKTFAGAREYPEWHDAKTYPFVVLMLRDGILYFSVMALSNIPNILLFCFATPALKGMLTPCTSSLLVIMMSRLMFNLHANARGAESVSSDAFISRISFQERSLPSAGEVSVDLPL